MRLMCGIVIFLTYKAIESARKNLLKCAIVSGTSNAELVYY